MLSSVYLTGCPAGGPQNDSARPKHNLSSVLTFPLHLHADLNLLCKVCISANKRFHAKNSIRHFKCTNSFNPHNALETLIMTKYNSISKCLLTQNMNLEVTSGSSSTNTLNISQVPVNLLPQYLSIFPLSLV